MSRSERVARDTSERSRWRRLPKLSEGVSVQKRSGTAAHAWRRLPNALGTHARS